MRPVTDESLHAASSGALAGVRVVDLTTVLMAPLATRMMADHGADVIRVESIEGEPFLSTPPARSAGMNWFALNLHRNKRSLALDLKQPSAAASARRLVASADVVVSNMRRGALERLGLDAVTLCAAHPRLIHCTANGYRSDGPGADRAAYDDAIQAASGFAALHNAIDGVPRFAPAVLADKVCGLHILQAVLAALFFRERTGRGQAIEVPMFETMVAFNLAEHHAGHIFDPPVGNIGYTRVLNRSRKPYRSADGWVCLLPYTERNWRDFFEFVGQPAWVEDPRFGSHSERIANSEALYGLVEELAPLHTVAEWLEFCDAHSIPAAPVMDLADAPQDPNIQAVDLLPVVEHPTEGRYRAVRDPIQYQASPTALRRHAPRPGQHSAEILRELGLEDTEVAAMVATGAVSLGAKQ